MKHTTPKLSTKNPKDWYVYFRFTDSTGTRLIKERKGINRIKKLSERRKTAEGLLLSVITDLGNKWNPITNTFPVVDKNVMLLKDAMIHGLNKKKPDIATKTFTDYEGAVRFFNKSVDALGLNIPVRKITRKDVLEIFEHYFNTTTAKGKRSISNHRYNKVTGYIKAVFTKLVKWEILDANPAHGIEPKPVTPGRGYIRADDEEQEIIIAHLKNVNYPFYVFVACIYHSLTRPKELLHLQVKDFAKSLEYFWIYPDLITENSKTKEENRKVFINPHMKELLLEMNIFDYPKDYYVFGSSEQKHHKHVNYSVFKPNKYMLNRKYASDLWKKLIKDKPPIGLGLEVSMYSNKHKSIDDKLLDGVSIDSLQEQAGHAGKQMTKRYASKLFEVAAKDIAGKARKF